MKCTFEPVFNLLLCIAVSNEFGFESCLHLKEQKLKTPSSLKSPFAHSIFLLSTCNVGLKTWKNKEKQGLLNPLDTPICNSNSNHFNIPEFLRLWASLEKWALFLLDTKKSRNYWGRKMLQFENERNLEVVVIARVLIQTNGIIAFDLFDPIWGCIWVRIAPQFLWCHHHFGI